VKGERVYLGHIRDAINDIEEYASVGATLSWPNECARCHHSQVRDHRRAVKQLSNATKDRRREIPSKQIAGMRDRLTHAYFGVDLVLL
jgi:uncharacterized protein with HEPN domain